MTEFIQPNEVSSRTPRGIATTFNGVTLDEIEGFETLTVTGRGLIEQENTSEYIPGVDGEMEHKTTVKPRRIVVKAKITAIDKSDIRRIYKQLNKALKSSKAMKLKFSDEPYFFNAIYEYYNEPEEDRLEFVINIDFFCANPYKYTDEKTTTINGTGDILDIDTDYPVVADEIRITFSSATDARDFTLSNTTTDKRIVYRKDIGTVITVINQKAKFLGSTAGTNRINGLDLTFSDFLSFRIDDGDQLVVTPTPVSVQIKYRGVSL